MRITKQLRADIIAHAAKEYPKEACGVIVNKEYIPCRNVSEDPTRFFSINPIDLVQAESKGAIEAYVHSHPNGIAEPSEPDLVQLNKHNKEWLICGYTPNEYEDVKSFKPNNFKLPLLGRSYFHGLQDCYSLIKDFYYRELNITLNDYERIDKWWLEENTKSLYLDNFKNEGFIEIDLEEDSIQKYDVILFRLGRTHHINHAGIFLEDGTLTSEAAPKVIGNSLFIHHPYDRQAVREIYGNVWSKRTAKVLRHNTIINKGLSNA